MRKFLYLPSMSFVMLCGMVFAMMSCSDKNSAAPEGGVSMVNDVYTDYDGGIISFGQPASGQSVYVEPLCWWTGMKTPLQLMIHAEGIGGADVRIEGNRQVRVKAVHNADSPNYLFVDVEIAPKAKAGNVDLVFSRDGQEIARQSYPLFSRVEGSAWRESYTTADMMYLIMPDRFSNGDPDNDASPLAAEQPDRGNSFGRHGGDLQGIINHLDYLEQLGVTAVWCTPLTFDNDRRASFHGYACSDYVHIDPRYGSNALFRDYVAQCHSHGIKVISDFVPNHCGITHWWMEDLPFDDWVHQFPRYTNTNICFSTNMDINASSKDLYYQESGWFARSMPDINLDNPFVRHYFTQVAVWWTEWSGLDGFRIDTYPYNEKEPAAQMMKDITNEYPNLNLVGECWTPSIPQLAYWQRGNANKDGFNSYLPSIMDFPLRDALIKGINAERQGLQQVYEVLSHDFVYEDLSHMLIFGANHDTERLGSIFHADVNRMKMMTALLATLRGIPQTYYGDELMFLSTEGRGDSAWRGEFPGGWEGDETNLFTREGRNEWQNELFDFNSRLWQWRKTSLAVQKGKTLHFLSRDGTYAFFRYLEGDAPAEQADGMKAVESAVFVFANSSQSPKRIPWNYYDEFTPRLASATDGGHTAVGVNVLTGEEVTLNDDTFVPAGEVLIVDFR